MDQRIEQTLHSLDLDRLWQSVQALVQRELADAELSAQRQRLIADSLAVEPLRAALLAELSLSFEADLYQEAATLVGAPEVSAVLAACQAPAGADLGGDLEAYQAKLAAQAARPLREQLARQMDTSARTSRISALLYNRVERMIIELTLPELSDEIPWPEVTSERTRAMQQSVTTWYLYCTRYAEDSGLRLWIDRHDERAVQQVLDHYEQALALVLERIARDLARRVQALE